MEKLYALHDYDKTKTGMFQIDAKDAKKYNEQGYGIHWMPQVFKGGVRKLENLENIRYWVADIDNGSKDVMMKRIGSLIIAPTFVVETKRGFHVYWKANDATLDNYSTIERGISDFLCADGSLITPAHTLRFPGFYHQKNPKEPFLVQIVYKNIGKSYDEALMLRAFKPKPKYEIKRQYSDVDLGEIANPENWERYFRLSQIVDGGRNNGMNKIAWRLKEMGADEGTVLQLLLDMNKKITHPLDYSEIQSIVRGKFK